MKWWHTLASIAAAVAVAAAPQIQSIIAGHPIVSGILGFAWAIIGHLIQSPLQQQAK